MTSPATTPIRHASAHLAAPMPVYYEVLEPLAPTGKPTMVLLHGGAHTGSCYLHTADGRPGWAHRFVARGYRVVVPDWPGSGRSGYIPPAELTGEIVCQGLGALIEAQPGPVILLTHSMSGAFGWRLLEEHGARIERLVGIAPGLPGNIQAEPTILRDTAEETELQSLQLRFTLSKTAPYIGTADFVAKKIIGDGSRFPRAAIPAYVAQLGAIAPRIIHQRLNVGGMQHKVRDTAPFRDKPILVLTGTNDIDHPRAIDEPIVHWLNSIGARAEFCWLGDLGITGNGHMLMLEDNSDQLADLVADWIERGTTAR